ncbi:enoyl-CoA hydratase-related protein [Wenzhouxiangella marina]|uniref:Enoyl-CoA hydratase n=1 Tax=Wenzhouxiangella marina TaxID=1579979 RepID=A0A0K0XUX1_9GAMM|nr:enoyl-CoA hydratase-related protein [Wenzhouxiangella marina]AKS41465.1 enoyl-CoA hydratase [Wenzhouxiangella marina]MBB6086778.1 methylglutaconyl-CoA hydratase [Wenzhouxiangella marina]
MSDLLTLNKDERGVATLTLNRPEVHNAFNAELIAELSAAFDQLLEREARALVLTGAGHSFSAGADLNWMRAMAEGSEADNRADARALAAMLRKLDRLPCPTIARVNGAAFGGGVGLISCCDLAVGVDSARFGLTEVRLGLAPATIAPFVMNKIGRGAARRYMLTGERFGADTALSIGLLAECTDIDGLDRAVDRLLEQLLAGGPHAQGHVKELIRLVANHQGPADELDLQTSELIAALRVSREGQEGLSAFLEKRKPGWTS